jgi:hypothetical protein
MPAADAAWHSADNLSSKNWQNLRHSSLGESLVLGSPRAVGTTGRRFDCNSSGVSPKNFRASGIACSAVLATTANVSLTTPILRPRTLTVPFCDQVGGLLLQEYGPCAVMPLFRLRNLAPALEPKVSSAR